MNGETKGILMPIGGAEQHVCNRVVLRRFACPGCGALLDSETALPEDPFLNDILFDRGDS